MPPILIFARQVPAKALFGVGFAEGSAGGSAFAGVSACAAIPSSNVRQIVGNERVEEIRAVFMISPGNEQEAICRIEWSGVKKKRVSFRLIDRRHY
ncbi:MAG TPA: hypothetical protein VHX68_15875 [Planctomycetaceae bacterium]|nr:hypothetical protein [Planctomycetaceae bacterium]